MNRVTVIGGECSGKSTLAAALSARLGVPWVPEAARLFVERAGRAVRGGDEAAIARLHARLLEEAESEAVRGGATLVILDTDLLSTVVYARYYQGSVPGWVVRRAADHRADLYLLASPDIPFHAESTQRGSESDRAAVYRATAAALRRRRWPVVVVRGDPDGRLEAAVAAIREAGL